MSNERVSAETVSPPLEIDNLSSNSPSAAQVAAVMLPALKRASTLLVVATKMLTDLSSQPRRDNRDVAAEAREVRRLIATFGRVPPRR